MGGKRKQAARTKGNTRPSNSGRTAEMLASSGNALPSFVGFGGFQDLTSVSDDMENAMDADFRLALKKMTKRDTTTKLKAIQEFNSLCKEKSTQDMLNSLSMWPRLFNKLAMDCDRRIRESLFQAHEQLVIGIKKALAPHLRSIMGTWLMGRCDPYLPAATAAENSFNAAFPLPKQAEAIAFCKTEIIAFIEDNLFQQTARTLSDPECTPTEEMESKYIRVISSSLLTLKLVIDVLPPNENSSLMDSYKKIFSEPKFWKFAKDENQMIRRSWFSLISSICQHLKSSLDEKKLCTSVFNALDETDSTVSPFVWEAIMCVVSNIDDCWSHVNCRKMLIPKLWTVLQGGGHGNAKVIFPNLVLLLHKLPTDVAGDVNQFYTEFFTRMRTGLSLPVVQSSLTEMNAIIEAFVECFKFLVVRHIDNTDVQLDNLIEEQILSIIRMSFCDATSKLSSTRLYRLISDMLAQWSLATSSMERYVHLKKVLIGNVQDLCVDVISTNYTTNVVCVNQFLLNLMGIQKSSSSNRVHFKMNGDEKSSEEEVKSNIIIEKSSLDLISAVCIRSLEQAEINQSLIHLKLVSSIVEVYPEETFLSSLLGDESTRDLSSSEIGKLFFDKIITRWLGSTSGEFIGDLINLLLPCYKLADDKIKLEILNTVCQTKNPLIIEKVLRKWNLEDTVFVSWLSSNQFSSTLLYFTKMLCCRGEDSCLQLEVVYKLMALCLSSEIVNVLSSKCLNEIFDLFHETITEAKVDLEQKLYYTCSLLSVLFTNLNKELAEIKSSIDVVVAMFKFISKPPKKISDKIINEMETSFSLAMKNIKCDYLIRRVEKCIKEIIENENFNLKKLAQVTSNVIATIAQFKEINIGSAVELFFNPDWHQITGQIKNEWTFNALLEDKLTLMEIENEDQTIRVVFIRWCYFFCRIFMQTEAESRNEWEIVLKTHAKQILFARVYLQMTDIDNRFKYISEHLDEFLKIISSFLEPHIIDEMFEELCSLSLEKGGLWSLCLQEFYSQFKVNQITLPNSEEFSTFPLTSPQFHTTFVSLSLSGQNKLNWMLKLVELGRDCDLTSAVQLISLSRRHLEILEDINETQNEVIISCLDLFLFWRDKMAEWFIFSGDINAQNWITIAFNVEMQRFLSLIVEKFYKILTGDHWDFILCALCSWIQSCGETSFNSNKFSSLFFIRESCLFFTNINQIMEESDKISGEHPHLIIEWSEFFSEGVFAVLLPLFISISESNLLINESFVLKSAVLSLSSCVEKIPAAYLEKHQFQSTVEGLSDTEDHLPVNLRMLLYYFCQFLRSTIRPIQLCSFRLLFKLIPLIAKSNEKNGEKKDENSRNLPESLKKLLTETTSTVNVLLANEIVTEADELSRICFMSYLLSWSFFMDLFIASSSEFRSEYASYLHSSGLLSDLLANLFNLIPETLTQSSKLSTMFNTKPALISSQDCTLTEIEHQACQVYFESVKKLPALVRQWWNNQDKRLLCLVDKVTSKYVSPVLCLEELEAVQNSGCNFTNMSVRSRIKSSEVIAIYTIDEVSVELIIKLAPNHPLGAVTVECGKRIGVGQSQWRTWMLQLNTFLTYQNGSVLEGLNLWKRNVDKKFEGIEECYICYYVLHGSNCQLPKVTCRTCKKKFHSACLYNWFSTSNQSTCPLCRNLF